MLQLGKRQTLIVERMVDFGAYLRDEERTGEVLLPKKEVPEGIRTGDPLEVFLYLDSKDRRIATVRESALTLGGFAVLTVKDVNRVGAFLDWGLEKDLLLPFHEQTRRVKPGEEVLAALYIDKSGRLCATMNVYPYLFQNSPYQIGDMVKARIYEISENFGVFAAVDDRYSALIPRQEAAGDYYIGDVIDARVTAVKEDGRLNLSSRKKAYLPMEEDAQLVLRVIDEFDGVLPFSDKTTPEVIRREFGLSKNAFKRAVGHLLKEGKIRLGENRIFREP